MEETMVRHSGGLRQTVRRAMAARRLRSDAGQTPTEYLMIVGIMAAVILIAFITFFWEDVQKAAENWAGNAAAAVDSSNNAESNTIDKSGGAKK